MNGDAEDRAILEIQRLRSEGRNAVVRIFRRPGESHHSIEVIPPNISAEAVAVWMREKERTPLRLDAFNACVTALLTLDGAKEQASVMRAVAKLLNISDGCE